MSGFSQRFGVRADLVMVVALAVLIRIDSLWGWSEVPSLYFVDDLPLILNVDGYYYLDLARSLLLGEYTAIDHDRVIPEGVERTLPAPLLSVLTALVQRVSGVDLMWIGVVLPAVLGGLLAIPVYLVGYKLAGRGAALVAALVAILSPHYLQRTGAGWLDTDSLIVTFPVLIAWLFMQVMTVDGRSRWHYLAVIVPVTLTYFWWWDFGETPVLAAFAIPAVAALLFGEYPDGERKYVAMLVGGFIIVVFFFNPASVQGFVTKLAYLYESESAQFPAAGSNVVEQRNPTWIQIARESMAGATGLILALAGLLWLAVDRFRLVSSLGFVVGVGLLSISAARFLIFLAPILGLGLGYLVQRLWSWSFKGGWLVALSVLVIAMIPLVEAAIQDQHQAPLRRPYQVTAMKAMAEQLPQQAAIWTDWSHGYPILYFSQRGTFADGSRHSGRQLHALGVPLAASSPRVAANWIGFYAGHGDAGLDQVYERLDQNWNRAMTFLKAAFFAGPEQLGRLLERLNFKPEEYEHWRSFLFPGAKRPLYIFLDYDKIRTPWYRFGSWDFDRLAGNSFIHEPLLSLGWSGDTLYNRKFRLDSITGSGFFGNRKFQLKMLLFPDGTHRQYAEKGFTVTLSPDQKWGLLLSDNVLHSVGRQLYGRNLPDYQYLKPVIDKLPLYGVWEVHPDAYRLTKN